MSMTQHDTDRAATGPGGFGSSPEETVLEFVAGLPGFPASRRFKVEDLGETLRPFCRIHSVTEPSIALVVVPPGVLFPDYSVEIDEEHIAQLGLSCADDVVTLVIVTLPPAPQPPTANLLGPIVVNRRTRQAAQVVQHRSSYGVAEPIAAPGSAA